MHCDDVMLPAALHRESCPAPEGVVTVADTTRNASGHARPRISIIIPAWNIAPWIGQTLRSILSQTVDDFECIVIDDGSTDGTAQVVASVADPRIRCIRQPNAGVSAARNRGIAEAQGAFITFLDGDDYWLPCFLETLLPPLLTRPEVDLVYCGMTMFMDDDGTVKPQPWGNVHATGNVWWDMLSDSVMLMGAWLARAEVVKGCRPFDPTLRVGEDRDFLLSMLEDIYHQRHHEAVGIDARLLRYRQRRGSGVRQVADALQCEWHMMDRHLRHEGIPPAVRRRAYSDLAFKMGVIAAFGARDIALALRWYGKAFALCPMNGNLYWLPLRKMFLSLRPRRRLHMKVLFLSARADFGGGPEHVLQLLRRLPPDVEAAVACPEDVPYWERFRNIVGDDNMFSMPHRAFTLEAVARLRRFCRKRGFDVLHAHGKGAGLYARVLSLLCGIPSVYTFHGVHLGGYGPLKRWLYGVYERAASWCTRRGIAVSRGERDAIEAHGLMPASKVSVIMNGVEMPEGTAPRPAGPPWLVVSFSRFDMQKNSLFLLDVARALQEQGRLDGFRFLLVGDGPDRARLLEQAAAQGLGDRVSCPGATPTPHEAYAGALCYFSSSRWEGMPLAVLEAMAHGLPVVATDVVGNRDAVADGVTGLLYPEGDAGAAARGLVRLADEAALWAAMAHEARAWVATRHDVQRMADRTFHELRKACGRA